MANHPRSTIVELGKDSTAENRIGEIVKLERKIFPKHESLSKSFGEELKRRNCGLMYSLTESEEVAGYVMYAWQSSLLASITKLAGARSFNSFLVKDTHRRKGYGEALLKAAIDKCRTRKIQRICLHVDPARTAAFSLYKKLGFQIDNLIEHYYSPTRNAYRMYLDFDN
ncbi:hypothetical protein ACLOJK_024560 [Asimina triloba]